jgi:hypothetical protein
MYLDTRGRIIVTGTTADPHDNFARPDQFAARFLPSGDAVGS